MQVSKKFFLSARTYVNIYTRMTEQMQKKKKEDIIDIK